MASLRCHRCRRPGDSDTLDWSTTVRDGVTEPLCGQCTRLHVRDIESKLDDDWWVVESRDVLVVEDDTDTRLLIRMALESVGYVVDEAVTGEEAIALLEAGHLPAAMIVDVGLPGSIDGWGVRDRVRELDPETPVIVMSADSGEVADDPRHLDCDLMTKPFDMDSLVELVDRRTAGQAGVGLA